ncbi:MAG: ATP-binding cassette domain-containing protein [Opitutaceae bacterium]|nr:ATP-binding cassette domain-containing protein [Opitutaceae bacterium]
MKKPLLEIRGLTIRRGDATILDGVDWRVGRGERWVVLGPNGCGKTSLLRALTGYFAPTAGVIRLLGKTYGEHDWRGLRLRVGVVSSALQSGIPDGETALETVVSGRHAQIGLWGEPSPGDRRDARRQLVLAGLAGLEGRAWGHLSQGERQRVLIARSLMAKPALLILDEPCSGLDPVARAGFLDFVEGLARRGGRGPALVLVTHHIEEITLAFGHALLLKGGATLAAGRVGETLTSANLSRLFGRRVRVRNRRGARSLWVSRD